MQFPVLPVQLDISPEMQPVDQLFASSARIEKVVIIIILLKRIIVRKDHSHIVVKMRKLFPADLLFIYKHLSTQRLAQARQYIDKRRFPTPVSSGDKHDLLFVQP